MAIHTESLPVVAGTGGAAPEPAGEARVLRLVDGLLERAGPGEITVSPGAAAFLRARFSLEGPGPESPEAGHRLTGLADPEREQTRFVGRERELRLLDELFEQARTGQAQAVTIVGEPGIGKSRLVRELRRRLDERADWMEGRVLSGGRTLPLAPLVDLLQRVARIDETDLEPAVVEKLERRFLGYGPGFRAVLPFLRYLLSVDPGDPAVAGMDPTLRRAAIFDAMRRLVFRAAERFPRVVVIEDVHWIDQATEEWLRLLADGMGARPLLLILTSRPGHVGPFRERTPHTRIGLSALSVIDSVQLACALLATPDLPEALQRLIVQKAEGNPFFVEEVVRSLLEIGALHRDGERLTLARAVDEIAVPDTVQDVILARIERLAPGPRGLLEVAAVVGKDVPFDVLAEVADAPADAIRQDLRELQAAEFLYETSLYPEWEHTFKHALTHDVAYERLPAERRRALHARIVAAIERVHAGRLADRVERLARHALRGEEWAKALHYCRQAGARAVARSANPEAVATLEQALLALSHLPEGPDRVEQAIDVRFELRSALIPLGQVTRILGYLREAEALAATAGDRRRLGWVSAYMTIYFLLAGEHQRALLAGERAVRLGDELADESLAVVGRAYLGHVFRELGLHDRALHLFDEVVARLPGDRALLRFGQAVQPAVYALTLGALSRAAVGEIARAIAMAEEGLRISEAADRPFGMVLASLARAQVLTVQRAADEALALVARARSMIEARSLPLWSAWALAVEGWALALTGRFPDAVETLEQALALGERLPFLFGHSLWMIWLGLTHVLAGDLPAAERRAGQALELTRRRGERGYEAWAHYLTGEVASRRDPPDTPAAISAYEAAKAGALQLGMRPLAAHCHYALACALGAAGQAAEAATHLDAATTAYRALGLSAWPAASPSRPVH
jgi:tetratricopeptide (TPR) repeat protein